MNAANNCTMSSMDMGTSSISSMTMKGLHGKVALVAGGAGGIGFAVSLLLAKNGANVVVADINEEKAAKVVTSLPTESGAKHMAVKMDVTVMSDVQTALEKIHKTMGKIVELAVDSAGWMEGENLLMNMKEADFDHSINVNLKGAFVMMTTIAKHLENAKHPGSIVKIGSTLSTIIRDKWGHMSAAEAGAKHLVHVAAKEWADKGIRVNTVLAGLIDTPSMEKLKGTDMWHNVEKMTINHHVGKPEDVAEAVVFLLSDSSSYITGTELVVAGKPLM